jgi:hypothetical protein
MQERLCEAANVAVLIVECCKEFLVRGKVPFDVPLQMAGKYVQDVAMSDVCRHGIRDGFVGAVRFNQKVVVS